MSSATENRAAVFTSQPQAVEVYQSGAWWPGELLGWRHDEDGGCQVWVRVVLGGIEESAWTDLSGLRLPERPLAVAPEQAASGSAPHETVATPVSPAAAPATPARDLSETASLPLLRDRPAFPARAAGGNRPSGGRRRAPEDGSSAPRTAPSAGAAGRHRAPADPGRHRAADTGLLPAVVLGGEDRPTVTPRPAPGEGRTVPAPRSGRSAESLPSAPGGAWSATADPEPEGLTRPMRLSDLGPHPRRPRLDGSLAGV